LKDKSDVSTCKKNDDVMKNKMLTKTNPKSSNSASADQRIKEEDSDEEVVSVEEEE